MIQKMYKFLMICSVFEQSLLLHVITCPELFLARSLENVQLFPARSPRPFAWRNRKAWSLSDLSLSSSWFSEAQKHFWKSTWKRWDTSLFFNWSIFNILREQRSQQTAATAVPRPGWSNVCWIEAMVIRGDRRTLSAEGLQLQMFLLKMKQRIKTGSKLNAIN